VCEVLPRCGQAVPHHLHGLGQRPRLSVEVPDGEHARVHQVVAGRRAELMPGNQDLAVVEELLSEDLVR
jgi:hypothetical protein